MTLLLRGFRQPVIVLLRAYQLVWSPMRPPTCRFYPSCSAYALTAVERFGVLRGGWLSVRRLLRCHPWNPGGVDHVPMSGSVRPERMSKPAPEPVGDVVSSCSFPCQINSES